jgi:hypothetical protein
MGVRGGCGGRWTGSEQHVAGCVWAQRFVRPPLRTDHCAHNTTLKANLVKHVWRCNTHAHWSCLAHCRCRAPVRTRSWRSALQRHSPEFAAGSGFECRSHGATNHGLFPTLHSSRSHSLLCSRSLALFCLSVRARGWGRRGAVHRAVLPTLPSAGCRRPTPPPRRCCCRCCRRRCCRCRW